MKNQTIESFLDIGVFTTCVGIIVAVVVGIATVFPTIKGKEGFQIFNHRFRIAVALVTSLSFSFLWSSPLSQKKLGITGTFFVFLGLSIIFFVAVVPTISEYLVMFGRNISKHLVMIGRNIWTFFTKEIHYSSCNALENGLDETRRKVANYDSSLKELVGKNEALEKKISYVEKVLSRYERFLHSDTRFKEWLDGKDRTRHVLEIGGKDVGFQLCPYGKFMMGSPLTLDEVGSRYSGSLHPSYHNVQQHKVELTQDFYLAEYLVTKGEFRRFIKETNYKTTAEKKGKAHDYLNNNTFIPVSGSNWSNLNFEQGDDHPVVCISYFDAEEYIKWLNETLDPAFKIDGYKPLFRLPTEAEWEYACRAGTTTEFFWGDEEKEGEGFLNAAGLEGAPNGKPWTYPCFPFNVGYSATSPVGSFNPNPWGLYDMLGNVWEWTSDLYGDYPTESVVDPKGAESGSCRVLRGGCWANSPAYCRCACRNHEDPVRRGVLYGFRVAFSLVK